MPMKRKAKFDSERNCEHCLFFRNVERAPDGSTISGTCLVGRLSNLIKYYGVGCEDFKEDPMNPLPKRKWTEEQLEAQKDIRRSRRSRGDKTRTSIKLYREKKYPKLRIKAPFSKSQKKQAQALEILSDNKEALELLDRLFSLPKRSSKEGRKIRRNLRKIGFYLSRKEEEIKIKKPKPIKTIRRKGRPVEILELSRERIKEFQKAGIHNIDPVLLRKCAYYPRPKGPTQPSPCEFCSFKHPNIDCKRAPLISWRLLEKRKREEELLEKRKREEERGV